MNFERHRRGGRRITERGTLEEEEEKRHTGGNRDAFTLARSHVKWDILRRGGRVKVLKRERERRKEKFHGENRSGNERKEEGEEEGRWKKAAKHFFLLKFARASRAKRVFHPEPSLSFRSSVSSLF